MRQYTRLYTKHDRGESKGTVYVDVVKQLKRINNDNAKICRNYMLLVQIIKHNILYYTRHETLQILKRLLRVRLCEQT